MADDGMGLDSSTDDAQYIENGRGYGTYRRGVYLQPCDEKERDKLDIMHTLLKTVRGKDNRLLNAPFREMKPSSTGVKSRVLDLGCGTGIWLLDMAERNKETEFLGLDFSNMGPEMLLPNVDIIFPVDYESEWTLAEGSWDLIHLQMALGSVSSWPSLYRKILKHLKPGTGWFESVEIDFMPRCAENQSGLVEEGPLRDWYGYCHQAYNSAGRSITPTNNIETQLREAGFVDIRHAVYRLPLNPWPPEATEKVQHRAGNWYNIAMCKGQEENGRWNGGFGIQGICLAPLTRMYGWDPQTVHELVEHAMRQASDPNLHCYHNLHVWSARAPHADGPRRG